MENTFNGKENLPKCQKYLREFEAKKAKQRGKLFSFDLAKKMAAYNITKPIESNGRKYLLARVEPKDSERSKIVFF